MHQFYGHFFLPGKHMYCTHFMKTILSGIVQHVMKSNVKLFTVYIIIGYYFADFKHYRGSLLVEIVSICSY